MNNLLEYFNNNISPYLLKFSNNRYVTAITNGMILTVPFTIVGSIFMILANLPIAAYQETIEPYQSMLGTPTMVTFNVMAVIATIGIAYNLAKIYKLDTLRISIISLVCFLLIQVSMNEEGVYFLDTAQFGTLGVFTAMIISILVVEIAKFCAEKELTIKMPDNVPNAISGAFDIIIPLLISLVVVWIIRVVIGFDINNAMNTLLSPLVTGLNSLLGITLFMFLRSLLWCVGIHGGAVLGAADPIFTTMLGANVEAFAAGHPLPYITATGFFNFVFIGGGGGTLMLVIFMIFSKDEGLRTLGKLSLPSSIFQINEPIVFGTPIVFNPIMMIPYIIGNVLMTVLTYVLMYFNIIGRPVTSIPWTTPSVLSHYLTTGGDWRAAAFGVISIAVTGIIYYPFFKMLEKQRLEVAEAEENEEEKENIIGVDYE